MRYTDYCALFDLEKAETAFLSTYEFGPLFFEHRILQSKALADARRIVVFVDYGRYMKLMLDDEPARYFNQRYLVVPVKKPGGVFHAKLNLLLYRSGASIFCGSNNLTQAGCTHNLELLNAIHVDIEDGKQYPPELKLVIEAIEFFRLSGDLAVGYAGTIIKKWIEELPLSFHWLLVNKKEIEGDPKVKLVHSFKETPLSWFENSIKDVMPTKLFILSPFYDSDLKLLKRLDKKWPECLIEITAQQRTSNLSTQSLKKMGNNIKLFDLVGTEGRKLHAKLITVTVGDKVLSLSGSANFTTAAMDGINIEACFGQEIKIFQLRKLFDDEILCKKINIEDFEPGKELPPAEYEEESADIRLLSSVLDQNGRLVIQYKVNAKKPPESMFLVIKRFREEKPIRSFPIYFNNSAEKTIILDENTLKEIQGAIRCYLIALIEGKKITSSPSWLVQESKLTYEPSEGRGETDTQRKITETGRGLTEHLEYILKNEGVMAAIEYLENLNIRFYDGSTIGPPPPPPPPPPKSRDPSRPDDVPEWALELSENERKTLEQAYYDFADRQIHRVLQRHARRGNINGLRNFLDVYVTICKMMYKGYKEGILKPLYAMDKICRCVYSLTDGYKFAGEELAGYFLSILDAQSGNKPFIKEEFLEANVPGHLIIAMQMAQEIRWKDGGMKEARPKKVLPKQSAKVNQVLKKLEITTADDQIEKALDEYALFDEETKKEWLKSNCY